MMIRDVRLPRVICVLVTGGILGMTGAMMQGVTRNPIAEPSLLGISQGATLFVALLYASGVGATAGNTLLAALLGAFFSGVPVLIFTMKNPGNLSITKLLLAGTAMSTFLRHSLRWRAFCRISHRWLDSGYPVDFAGQRGWM